MRQQTFLFNDSEEASKEISKPKETPKPKAPPKAEVQAPQPRVYSVSEIVIGAKSLLEDTYSNVWVLGEVSGFKKSSSGHSYFTLKDDRSVLPAAMFKGLASKIKFDIENGQELICHGKISLYQRGGQFQLIVDYLEPKGAGKLQLAFEQLKKKLAEEGLFDAACKKTLPRIPKKIGIVTSPTGAAIRDILKVLQRRFPNIEVLIYPARVQGEGSAVEIAAGIKELNKRDDIDVMIIGRGGGSIEDLWAFNEEVVARSIFASRIPIISAVGHEVDFTIADFVADFRAPTPSAAAEQAVPVKEDLFKFLEKARGQLIHELRRNLQAKIDRVCDLRGRLAPPTKRFPEYYKYIDNLKERMRYSLQVVVNNKENSLKSMEAQLSHLSPLAVLGKGYSVVTKLGQKEAIKDKKGLKAGDSVAMRFSIGSAEAKVTKVAD